MTEDERNALKNLIQIHETDINAGDWKEYIQGEGNYDFHYRIIQGSKIHG